MYKWSERSLENKNQLHMDLQILCDTVLHYDKMMHFIREILN
jgi:hypothetical protein